MQRHLNTWSLKAFMYTFLIWRLQDFYKMISFLSTCGKGTLGFSKARTKQKHIWTVNRKSICRVSSQYEQVEFNRTCGKIYKPCVACISPLQQPKIPLVYSIANREGCQHILGGLQLCILNYILGPHSVEKESYN